METEYRTGVEKLLSEGTLMDPKNSTKYAAVIAYQMGKGEKIVLPDGTLLKTGDWLCLPRDEISNIQKQLDTGQPITGIYSIKRNTMQKSYRQSGKPKTLIDSIKKFANQTEDQQQSLLNALLKHALAQEERADQDIDNTPPNAVSSAQTSEQQKKMKELLKVLKIREAVIVKQASSTLKKKDSVPK